MPELPIATSRYQTEQHAKAFVSPLAERVPATILTRLEGVGKGEELSKVIPY